MPTYRSITIELHSQFDIEKFPEYRPRSPRYYADHGIQGTIPPHIDDGTSTCSVYIPVLPGSQFWIRYSVSPPVPDDQLFLFKLFINGAHIVNWSTDKEHRWRGKTMFGLYERENEDGSKRIEKRVLCFTPPDKKSKRWSDVTDAFDPDAYIEIRVHRAHASKRITRQVAAYKDTAHGKSHRGIDLVNAGRADAEQPKRFYKFALVDPTDQPFASFRYYYRTWNQLHELDVYQENVESSEASINLPVIEPQDPEKIGNRSASDSLTEIDGAGVLIDEEEPCWDEQSRQLRKQPRPLSVPPSLRLSPPKRSSRELPLIPQRKDIKDMTDTGYHPHPVYAVDDWVVRTPSPVKSIREGITTPPPGKRRGFSAAALMNVIASTWKRRGMSTLERVRGGSRASSRNVS